MTVALQTATAEGLVIAVGLCFVLAASGVIAWQRRSERFEELPANEQRTEPTGIAGEPFLTNEEQVIRLLESNGGRMRQSQIIEATDWSKSKVSMLLSEMEQEELISKLRVGRENIISRPGFEPEATHSSLKAGA